MLQVWNRESRPSREQDISGYTVDDVGVAAGGVKMVKKKRILGRVARRKKLCEVCREGSTV